MKRLLFKSIVVVLFVFFVGNYLIYLKTGHMPLRDMKERMGSDWWVDVRELLSPNQLAEDAKGVVKQVTDQMSEPEAPQPVKVYKWTDANGQVHFSDKPVANGAKQMNVELRNAISAPDESVNQQVAAPESTKPTSESALDKARAAADAMQQRVQQQEQVQ
ncbi:DUF4124 domain-containing protein [Cellvibrio sp. NN19]|uniref:DUF4124 domain-containing protein n=1 Tax=Cellvibrio chitinivorans TaxID=3102792 RepID=UPI002B4132B1|nr:DUF4124 domain-containing protein [Cellvibrio sp. NN19]